MLYQLYDDPALSFPQAEMCPRKVMQFYVPFVAVLAPIIQEYYCNGRYSLRGFLVRFLR